MSLEESEKQKLLEDLDREQLTGLVLELDQRRVRKSRYADIKPETLETVLEDLEEKSDEEQ